MKDEEKDKTKEQLINELIELRNQVSELKIYKNVLDQLPISTIIYDKTEKVIYRNNSSKQLNEYENDQLLQVYRGEYLKKLQIKPGKTIKVNHPKMKTGCFDNGIFGLTETTLLSKNDNLKNVLLIGNFIYDDENNLQGACGCALDISEFIRKQKRAQKELMESEERYRMLFNNTNDAIFVYGLTSDNLPGKFIEVNDVACQRMDYSRDELLLMTPTDINPKEHLSYVQKIVQKIVTQGNITSEMTHVTKNGVKIPVEISSHVFYLNDKKVVLTIARDITERKHMEEELRKANTKISNILESITDAFYTMDKNWTITYMNSTAEEIVSRIIGRKKGSSVGKNRWELLPLYVGTNLYYEYHKAMAEQIPVSFEVISPYTKLYYEFNVYPSAEGLSVYFRDIIERKKMEEKLKLSEERFYKVFNFSPAAMTIHSMNSDKLIEANESCLKMHEYNRDELIGRSALDLGIWVDMDDRVKFRKEIMTKGFAYNHEIINRKKSGEIFTALLSGVVIDLNGEKCVLVIKNDITELRQYQKEMARLSKLNLVGEMAAGIAHEVRNPMTTVRGFLQLLGNKKEYVQYKEYHELMLEELDRANSIITEFLSLAKDRADHLEVRNLNSILETMYPLINADAMNLGKDVKLEYGNIPDLLLNEKEIRQLVLNLVRNGFEAMYNGGCLIIKTLFEFEGENVVLMVKDQGKGISVDVLDKIGTPFFTTRADGTGLGLAISYSIAKRHNAIIDFNTGPEGTTFYVRFKN